MASAEDDSKKQAGSRAPSSRRHFLRVAITLGVVFVTAGIASVAKRLFEPSTAQPGPPPSGTKTVTKTVTSTVAPGERTSTATSTGSTTSTSASSSPFG